MAISVIPVEGVAYTANAFDDLFEALALRGDAATQGIIRGKLNTLAVTGATSPVAVASGWAWVNGKLVINTASVNVTVSTPASATRIDRIILRLDYTANPNTIALVDLQGAEGGTAPALTQTDGTTWELDLATISITTGGAITIVSLGAFAGDGQVAIASLANNAVTDAKLRQGTALTVVGRAANSTGNVADIAAGTDGHVLRRSGTTLGFGTITAAGIANRNRYWLAPLGSNANVKLDSFGGWTFPDGASNTVGFMAIIPADFEATLQARILCGGPALGVARFQLKIFTQQVLDAAYDSVDVTQDITIGATSYIYVGTWRNVNGAEAVAGAILMGELTRLGAHANDTCAGIVYALGIQFQYTADS